MEFAHLLQGIILSGFFGLAIGNFATNPIYRLPRRESLFLRDPYCGDCNAKLLPKDLFPVLSWLSTRGKCRYCGASVPGSYTATEALIGLLFVICFVKSGWSEAFVLVSFGTTAFVMLAMMLYIDNFFSGKTVVAAIVMGVVYRTLFDHTIYDAGGGMFAGLLIGGFVWRYSGRELIRDIAAFPPYLCLLVAAGAWLPLMPFFGVCVAGALATLFRKGRPWIVEWTLITATVAEMLILMPSS